MVSPPPPTVASCTDTRQRLKKSLFGAGFDIFHGPFLPRVYNDLLESEGLVESGRLKKLPEEIVSMEATATATATTTETNANRTQQIKTEAYLIGNTKHLWPIFLRWLREENERKHRMMMQDENTEKFSTATSVTVAATTTTTPEDHILIDDPLDTYEQTAIEEAVERVLDGNKGDNHDNSKNNQRKCYRDLYWSSDLDPSRMVSVARIASCTGFSYLDPGTHLSVHPTFGTWHSYRAVLLLGMDPTISTSSEPSPPPPKLLSNPMSAGDTIAAKEAFDRALDTSKKNRKKKTETAESPPPQASDIGTEDRRRLKEELGRGIYKEEDRKSRVANAWMALRDAVSIGKESYRFCDDQLLYHYTKDKACLSRGISGLP